MYAYKKYVQEPIQFVNYSKQIYATNELPKTVITAMHSLEDR